MSEVIVTAPRMLIPLEVVTDPKAPRQPVPAHDGADYLKSIPGFSVIRKGGSDSDPVFRGMAGSRISILTDGENLLGGCGMRMDPPTAYIFPSSYDSIRLLKGPQAVLWGPTGSAATVLFERDIYDHDSDGSHLEGSALAAAWGRHDLAVDALAGNTIGYLRLQGSDARSGDYRDGDGEEVHSHYHRWNGSVALGLTPMEHTLLELSAAASDGEAAYADRMMDGSKFQRENVGLKLRKEQIGTLLSAVEAQFYYNYIDHVMDNYSQRRFTPSMMMPNPSASNPDRKTSGGRLQLTLTPVRQLEWKVGVDAQQNDHSVRSSMNQMLNPYQALRRTDDASFEQRGLFTELSYQQSAARKWVAGLRTDEWQAEDHRLTVRQGMMNLPNASAGAERDETLTSGFARVEQQFGRSGNTTAYAGIGRAERFPDYWELIGNDKQSVASNSAFFAAPEQTTQIDVGIIHQRDGYSASLSLFANRIDDYLLIDTRVAGKPMNTAVTRNIDVESWGGEADFSRNFAHNWTAEGTLAYTRGHNRSDDRPLAQIAPLELRLGLRYGRDAWSLGGLMRAVDDQRRVDPGRGNIAGQDIGATSGFTTFALNGAYRFSEKLQLTAGVDNLFNRTYAEHLSRSGAMVAGFVQSDRINEPGRLWWAKIDAKF